MKSLLRIAAALCAWSFWLPAGAAVPTTLYDAATHCTAFAPDLTATPPNYDNYVFCDDGVPAVGGTTANVGGLLAVTVPAKYAGYAGLPAKAADATSVPGSDPADGTVALDVDVSLPLVAPPAAGYPLLVFMHGCCGGSKTGWEATGFDATGESWHYNNAWFASRGYVVINYTARGFVNSSNHGSTGETQLDSRLHEVNDLQSLACQVYAHQADWGTVAKAKGSVIATASDFKINPLGVVVTGGSYGGGLSWMAVTDPKWTCNADSGANGTAMQLAAAAPMYGWTDLLYSLVPTGSHRVLPGTAQPAADGCDSGPRRVDSTNAVQDKCTGDQVVGVPKQTITAALYASGKTGTPTGFSHTTFPQAIDDAEACLQSAYPPETNPLCDGSAAATNVIEDTLPEFLRDRSAYYQDDFWTNIAGDTTWRTPIFNAGTLTDPLFPPSEDLRMYNRLKAVVPDYPIEQYFGDYQHFQQNKAKEWGDLCGGDHHVCTNADYPGGDFNVPPTALYVAGAKSRLNRFIDFYANPPSNTLQTAPTQPPFDTTAALTVCPQKATGTQPADEPGPRFTAPDFPSLSDIDAVLDTGAPVSIGGPTLFLVSATSTTTSNAGGGTHAEPVADSQMSNKCPTRQASDAAPNGVAVYNSVVLSNALVLLGTPSVQVDFTLNGGMDVEINARLYEELTDGSAVMASRGFRRLTPTELAAGTITFELFANGWSFTPGNKIRLEIAQDDSPYMKASSTPSSLNIDRVKLTLPVRLASTGGGGGGGGGSSSGGGAFAGGPLLAILLGAAALRRRRGPSRA